jgi:ankyrin repeat protein
MQRLKTSRTSHVSESQIVCFRYSNHQTGLHKIATVSLSNNDHGPMDIKIVTDVITCLIKAGTDINGVDFDGNTPFLDAVESDRHFASLKIRLQAILNAGGVANASNHRGQTALHKVAALETSILELIDFLLQESLELDLHARDNEGTTALHIAAAKSSVNTWKFVQAGADIHAKADDLRTALHFAAGGAQSNIVGLLCKLSEEESCTVDQIDETVRMCEVSAGGSCESKREGPRWPNATTRGCRASNRHYKAQERAQIRKPATLEKRVSWNAESLSVHGC